MKLFLKSLPQAFAESKDGFRKTMEGEGRDEGSKFELKRLAEGEANRCKEILKNCPVTFEHWLPEQPLKETALEVSSLGRGEWKGKQQHILEIEWWRENKQKGETYDHVRQKKV